jgi:phage virion morphogenesis protein
MKIAVKIQDAQLKEALSGLASRVRNMTPIMKEIGEIVRTSVERNFAETGRPEKWPESQRVKRGGGQTLSRTGRLRRSFTVKASKDRVEVGTNVVYAAIHQFGGTITQGARSELFTRNRYVRGDKKGQFKKGTKAGRGVTFGERRINIPARPFLMVQDEDWSTMNAAISDYLMDNYRGR